MVLVICGDGGKTVLVMAIVCLLYNNIGICFYWYMSQLWMCFCWYLSSVDYCFVIFFFFVSVLFIIFTIITFHIIKIWIILARIILVIIELLVNCELLYVLLKEKDFFVFCFSFLFFLLCKKLYNEFYSFCLNFTVTFAKLFNRYMVYRLTKGRFKTFLIFH